MSLSIVADVLDKLYDGLTADTTLAALVAAEQLIITDGPPITDWSAPSLLVVGSGPTQDDEQLIEADSNWATLATSGALADVDENLHIPCGITTVLGDATAMRSARRAAFDIYAAAYAFIRGTTLGLPQVMWCAPQFASMGLRQTADGAEILISFTAHVVTRI